MTRYARCLPLFALLALALLSGCSSSSDSAGGSNSGGLSSGTVSLLLSDAPAEDWATIGVKVLSVSLVPQGGGSPVPIYSAPNPPPTLNLVQLDDLGEIIVDASVPAGTYVRAQMTLAANPGDVILTASANPEPGFAGTPGDTVPPAQIHIQGANGTPGNLIVPLNVTFSSPLVVTAGQTNVLDLEFDLAHPAFLVAHVPPASGIVMWAVNFNGPVRHRVIRDITRRVLRHLYGNVTAVAADGSSLTITKHFPVFPPTTPETSVATTHSLQILPDSVNGTLFYNLDTNTKSTLFNFTSLANTLVGKYVRIAARYQSNGTLVAVRIWAGSTFQSVWFSPEGHILHINTTTNVITLENENGVPVQLLVDANTQFFFRLPQSAQAANTPIGTGTGFLANLVRGFKVHVSVVDPLASTLVAQTVDIEIARFDGSISLADSGGFTYTRTFRDVADSYTKRLTYIGSATANGMDPVSGAPITGFKYWLFAFPTLVSSGPGAINDFISIANGAVNFGGTAGTLKAFGTTHAVWNDPAGPGDWSAPWVAIAPSPIPLGTVATSWIPTGTGGSFTMQVGGGTPATVTASSVGGSATLVYQLDRTAGGIVTVSPQDLTTAAGLNNVASQLQPGALVKVFGVPQANGIKAYSILYYTGAPTTR